jgi:PKD repeat protein
VYGAENIKIRCDNVGISNTYTTSTGPLHMLDGSDNGTWNPAPNEFWSDTLIPKTTSFLYELVKPTTTFISSQNDMICQNNNLNLEVTREHENSYFIWDFDNSEINTNGDINNNTLSFDFNSPGIYSISVVEFNEILCAGDTLTFNIEVHEVPEADFMYFSDLFEFEFTNLSSNAVSYAWDFGDGNTSTDENPIHTYSEVGDYEVSLTVTSADNCTSTFTQTVNIIDVLGLTEDGNELTYASPFTHTFELTSVNTLGQITIISIDGKKVYNNYHQDNSIIIDTESWSKGIYFVNLTNEDGEPKQFKVIKQ